MEENHKPEDVSFEYYAHRGLSRATCDLVKRREDILAGQVLPRWPLSRKTCLTCAFRAQCDYPHL